MNLVLGFISDIGCIVVYDHVSVPTVYLTWHRFEESSVVRNLY